MELIYYLIKAKTAASISILCNALIDANSCTRLRLASAFPAEAAHYTFAVVCLQFLLKLVLWYIFVISFFTINILIHNRVVSL